MKKITLILALITSFNALSVGNDGTDKYVQVCMKVGNDGTDVKVGNDGTDVKVGNDGTDVKVGNDGTDKKAYCQIIPVK